MSDKTKQFLALALIGRIGELKAEAPFVGVHRIRRVLGEIVVDATDGGFNAPYAPLRSVLMVDPCLWSSEVRNVLDRALDVAEIELEKEVG